jgi:dTDP-4-amino-4,6-dideoxygalactose transaminase
VCKPNVKREHLLYFLENNGIETRYLLPLLSQPVYKRLFPNLDDQYPVSQRLGQDGFFIGIHQNLQDDDIAYIADVFRQYFGAQI